MKMIKSTDGLISDESQIALIWKNLTVYKPVGLSERLVINEKCQQIILRDISGLVRFNDISAIMGPSGAGKSTLLQCLFGTWSNKYKGKIYRNPLAEKAAFITQREEDHLYPCLSVIESIFYASRLKGSQIADDTIVEELLDQMDLKNCRDTYVNSCSGGQRKRIAIAQELAAKKKPKILFLDEPTSGLDSNVSYMVLCQLRELTEKNKIAIVATIHQPSYKILRLFDQLYVISKAGKCLYQGKPSFLSNYLSQFQVSCPNGHNPADIVIDTAAINTIVEDGEESVNCFPVKKKNTAQIEISMKSDFDEKEISKVRMLEESSRKTIEYEIDSIDTHSMEAIESMRENNIHLNFRHIIYLLRRSFLHGVCREPLWLFIRTILHCVVALLLSMLYDGSIGRDDGCLRTTSDGFYLNPSCTGRIPLTQLREESDISRNVSFLFFNLLFLMFAALMPTILTFPSEIKVFLNEHRNGWYSTASYYWAKTFTEFWIQLVLPYVYCLYTYWATDQIGLNTLNDAIPFLPGYSRFKEFAALSILASYIAQGVGFLIGSLFTTNFNISIFVATVIMLFNFLFSGFFVRPQKIGKAQIITYLSFIRFAFESILLTIYGDNRCTNEILGITVSDSSLSVMPIEDSGDATSIIMFQFDLKDRDLKSNYIALIIHLILWRVLTFIVLYLKVNDGIPFRSCFRSSVASTQTTYKPFIKNCFLMFAIFVGIIILITIFSICYTAYIVLK